MKFKKLTPCRAIRLYCIECSGGSQKAPKFCENEKCPLWAFRMGHNPNRQGMGNKKDLEGLRRGNLSKKGIQRIITDGKYEVIIKEVKNEV